jgi:hypothetical protein
MRAVARDDEGTVLAQGSGLAPAVAAAPYIELRLGLLGGQRRRRFSAYRGGRGRWGTGGGWRCHLDRGR